jgi:chromosome segregation ATPase
MTEIEARQKIETLEVEVAELQMKSSAMSKRKSDAQAAQMFARSKIVEGDSKAPRIAAEAAEVIESLSPELERLSSGISSRQNEIVSIKSAIASCHRMDHLAQLAKRTSEARTELESAFSEGCSALTAALLKMQKAKAEILESKRVFDIELQKEIPDYVLRRGTHDASVFDDVAKISREIQARGVDMNDSTAVYDFERPRFSDNRCLHHTLCSHPKVNTVNGTVYSAFVNRHMNVEVEE